MTGATAPAASACCSERLGRESIDGFGLGMYSPDSNEHLKLASSCRPKGRAMLHQPNSGHLVTNECRSEECQ